VYSYTFLAKCLIVLFLGVTFSLRIRVNLAWTHNCVRYNLRFFFVRVTDVDLLVNSIVNISFVWNPSSVVRLNLSCHVTCIEIIIIVVQIRVIKVIQSVVNCSSYGY
jgi:hypothetical protein